MEWPNSPTEGNVPDQTQLSEDGCNLKRSLPQACNNKESESESDGPPRTKVNYISISHSLENILKLYGQRKMNRVLDSDDEVENNVGRQSKGQRKVSIPITPQIINYL